LYFTGFRFLPFRSLLTVPLAGSPGQHLICNARTAACKSAFFILLWFSLCRLNWMMAFFKLATVAFSTVDGIFLISYCLDFLLVVASPE
jgi:hypothetical protein